MPRRVLICLAFATWCFLDTWVVYAEGRVAYFARYDPLHAVAVPVVCCEIVLVSIMLAVWEICRRAGLQNSRLLHVLFLASCCVPLGIASVAALPLSPFNLIPIVRNRLFWPVVLMAATVPLSFAVMRPQRASGAMRVMFLCSWPVLAIILIQAARATLLRFPDAAYRDRPLAPALQMAPRVRVVWIIFDELSQTIAFGNRPEGLQLPNFDRLRAESFYATSAVSPGPATELSMPALTIGEVVVKSIPAGPDELQIQTGSRPTPFAWSSVPNVFDSARELGFNGAVVGWDHPYGRLLNRSLVRCYWTAGGLEVGVEERFQPQSLASAMWNRAKLQMDALPLVGHLPGVFPAAYRREDQGRRFSYLSDRARDVVADPSLGVALIHLPIPHPPSIYSRSDGTIGATGRTGYVDNVALADVTLGILRSAMEKAGLWDRTAVLVSADHGWRTSSWRVTPEWTAAEEKVSHQDTSGVPFLLKLPGQSAGIVYEKRFNTVVTRRMILDILAGRLTDAAQIADSLAAEDHK